MFWSSDIYPDNEPHKVLLKRGEFTDESRKNDDGTTRVVPLKFTIRRIIN